MVRSPNNRISEECASEQISRNSLFRAEVFAGNLWKFWQMWNDAQTDKKPKISRAYLQ